MSTATATNPWKVKASSGEGDFELPPGGGYPACLVGLIDLGTHDKAFGGKTTQQHSIYLVFELTGEFDSKGNTFKVAKDFTLSLNPKAKLRPFVEGWLGRKFAESEEIDLLSLINRNGVVNLAEGVSGGGTRYVDVASVNPPMKGLVVPPRTVEPVVFSLEGLTSSADESPIPAWVPRLYGRTVADEIKASHEWGQLPGF